MSNRSAEKKTTHCWAPDEASRETAQELRSAMARVADLMTYLRNAGWSVTASVNFNPERQQYEPYVDIDRRVKL